MKVASLARAHWASLLSSVLACSHAPSNVDRRDQAVINGTDDRLQAFQVEASVREALLGSTAALIFSHHLSEQGPNSVRLRAPLASEALGLCSDEPFANEPSAAFCTGVLIDDDLVATARHCLGSEDAGAAQTCRDTRVVFGYAISAPDQPVELAAEHTFACRRVVALGEDFALLQLDRSASAPSSSRPIATALLPRPIAAATSGIGDRLIVASHGAGLPLKLELAAVVTDVGGAVRGPGEVLTVAMDTFSGSSGGGLYNSDLELVALIAGGDVDWEAENGCARAAHSQKPREQASAASTLTRLVCDSGWPSARLCGREARCGDSVCSLGESEHCVLDCPTERCGDFLCEPQERGACPEDCSRYDDVPASWLGAPSNYPRMRADDVSRRASATCSWSAPARPKPPFAPLWVVLGIAGWFARRKLRSPAFTKA